MAPEIEIYDTTLRDGTQGHGISLSVADKLRIADRLDAFGVHYIEGGWPGSNPKDIEFFAEAKHRTFRNARLAAFGSTRRKDVAATADDQVQLLLDAATPVVTIFGKTSLMHVREVLQTTPEENIAMIADTVRFLNQHGRFVVYDAEHAFDGFREDAAGHLSTRHAVGDGYLEVLRKGRLHPVLGPEAHHERDDEEEQERVHVGVMVTAAACAAARPCDRVRAFLTVCL